MSTFQFGDASLRYEVAGSGSPFVVLVHGAMCSHADWAHQLAELSAWFTVLAPDLRGHGASTAPFTSCTIGQFGSDIHAMIESLGLTPVILVGHSLGARVAISAAGERPDNVEGLVLLDGSRTFGPGPLAPHEDALRLTDQQLSEWMSRTIEAAIGPFADAAVRTHVSTTMRSTPIGLMRALLADWQDWDINRYDPALAALPPDLPVLAIQSTRVQTSARRQSLTADARSTPYLDYLRHHVPSLNTIVLPQVGHFSMLEAPGEISRAIRNFARSVGPRGDAPSLTD
jgi:pimeloyl-ACP methyl ester carboxylesterase